MRRLLGLGLAREVEHHRHIRSEQGEIKRQVHGQRRRDHRTRHIGGGLGGFEVAADQIGADLQAGVVVQGVEFGLSPAFRISYAVSRETLTKACERLQKACAELVPAAAQAKVG